MMIFSSKIAREERFLANLHGTEYEYYRRHVRRFIPGLRHWLLLQALHASGHLPVLLVLP
ncbi:hypothetical protein QFZ34_004287 [Phyllobacterium ifriqiyense]|uniref:Uncharacterized protein n=1 Tax=Phyllobacterium ifriqiyense TaxID=314238 RepID=A0ABU0SEF0_9HYPH|nr:hypothetical protein [Phyllobacterium ifriqiyense]MDQ0999105.1 hypothetical protein [Phyllobacterium ifriqiyense]